MKIRLSIYTLLFFSMSFFANEVIIKEKVETILPQGAEIESIVQSEFPGIYKVYYGDIQPIYVSNNGDYFIFGDMFKISGKGVLNITDIETNQRRIEIIDNINSDELISFPSDKEIYKVTVFTDVECGYCRKLHDQIDEYNNIGISIHYAAFPRSGIGTGAFTKMVGAWCSNNPKKMLTDLKKGKNPNLGFCDTQPVAKHYAIGQKVGITGTPAIITSSGELLPGYYPPNELLEKLKG